MLKILRSSRESNLFRLVVTSLFLPCHQSERMTAFLDRTTINTTYKPLLLQEPVACHLCISSGVQHEILYLMLDVSLESRFCAVRPLQRKVRERWLQAISDLEPNQHRFYSGVFESTIQSGFALSNLYLCTLRLGIEKL